jgi:hypothetical protein
MEEFHREFISWDGAGGSSLSKFMEIYEKR